MMCGHDNSCKTVVISYNIELESAKVQYVLLCVEEVITLFGMYKP